MLTDEKYFIVINSGVLVIIIVHLFALTAIKELYTYTTQYDRFGSLVHFTKRYRGINTSFSITCDVLFHPKEEIDFRNYTK
jgi:uncharacterized protein YxeA